ncbi:MAG: hypothetical protein Q9219_003152 [cf. Caloplaca sp. 3 TL-2023]
MAPMAIESHEPVKRSSFTAGFDTQLATKRRKLGLSQRETARGSDSIKAVDGVPLHDEGVEALLARSISLALDAVGFKSSEPLALESLRVEAEEYIHRFAANVRQSMLSCRRTRATAQDFLQALHIHQLSLRALLPHLRPPVPPRRTRITLSEEPAQEGEEQGYNEHLLGKILDGGLVEHKRTYVPRHLPAFPSKHTYMATAEYPEREEDPRKIRERATEEGRLGEEALRRLVSAKAADRPSPAQGGSRIKSLHAQRDELWKQTMESTSAQYLSEQSRSADNMEMDLADHEPVLSKEDRRDFGRISSAVNADRRFWRKPAPKGRPGEGGRPHII